MIALGVAGGREPRCDAQALAEYEASGAFTFKPRVELLDTAWGTREFAIYDPEGNALMFYRDLF